MTPGKPKPLIKTLQGRADLPSVEWDFRWIENAYQERAVYRYEMGREIFREATRRLSGNKDALNELRDSAKKGYWIIPKDALFHPLLSNEELAYYLGFTFGIAGAARLDKEGMPPPAFKIKAAIEKAAKKDARGIETTASLTSATKDRAKRKTAPKGQAWIKFGKPEDFGPERTILITFEEYDLPDKSALLKAFKQWLSKQSYIPSKRKGRPEASPLQRLSAFRFSHGRPNEQPFAGFKKLLSESNLTQADYGKSLYVKNNVGKNSASTWSDDIQSSYKTIGRISDFLVHEEES